MLSNITHSKVNPDDRWIHYSVKTGKLQEVEILGWVGNGYMEFPSLPHEHKFNRTGYDCDYTAIWNKRTDIVYSGDVKFNSLEEFKDACRQKRIRPA